MFKRLSVERLELAPSDLRNIAKTGASSFQPNKTIMRRRGQRPGLSYNSRLHILRSRVQNHASIPRYGGRFVCQKTRLTGIEKHELHFVMRLDRQLYAQESTVWELGQDGGAGRWFRPRKSSAQMWRRMICIAMLLMDLRGCCGDV